MLKIPLEQFDISSYDSDSCGLDIPEVLLRKLIDSLPDNSEENFRKTIERETECKFRAMINVLAHAGLRQAAASKAKDELSIPYFLPRLSEIHVEQEQNLCLVMLQNKLVILAPPIQVGNSVSAFIGRLNALLNSSHGASSWILDLSLVEEVPFELFAYLIGLKRSLCRIQVALDLLWLKKDAVPAELFDSIQANFNLLSKGVFLLSR